MIIQTSLISAFLLLLKIWGFYCSPAPTNTEIILTHVIFRHGERTTFRFYPTDPHRFNETFYPIGLSGLTNKGKLMLFTLGEILRKEYGYLLGEDYSSKKVEVRSTRTERTLMSATLVLAGLWPPSEKQKWHPTLMWQPIPVFSVAREVEDLLDAIRCKRRNEILADQLKNVTVQEIFIKPYQELISYVEKHAGVIIKDIQDILDFWFILKTEDDYGLILPEWTESIYPEPLTSAAASVYRYTNYNPEVKMLQSGYLLKKILNDYEAKINNKLEPSERKMFLYSGHDSTLGHLLYALDGLKPEEVPPYGSAIFFELHKSEDNYYIKLKYLRHPLKPEIKDWNLPDCETLCPIGRFNELVANLLPNVTYKELCL